MFVLKVRRAAFDKDSTAMHLHTPSEFTGALRALRERRRSALTTTLALLVLAAVAFATVAGGLDPRLTVACGVLATLGGAGAFVHSRLIALRRDDLCDDILVSSMDRHVAEPDVAARASRLVSARERGHLATTLERFVDAAHMGLPLAVPLSRRAVRDVTPQLRALTEALRSDREPVTAAGMVLVRRLITDGAGSPLYHSNGEPRRLEQALVVIETRLTAGDELSRAA